VFKIKHGVDGEIERYKARLMARGFTQTFRVDYNETFAFVAKIVSICCILALVAIEDMKIHQMDVKTAFFNGDLEEEIYMEQPKRFIQEGDHLVCKLHKSLYALKQFPRAWNQKLDVFFKSIKFVRSDADFSVYVAQVEDVKFFIVIYVDDLILVCNNKDKLFASERRTFSKVRNERSWRLAFLPWHGSGKGSCTTFFLHQPNWVSQGDSQMLSHGGLQSHRNAT
jgi:hypothetical protein